MKSYRSPLLRGLSDTRPPAPTREEVLSAAIDALKTQVAALESKAADLDARTKALEKPIPPKP